jgi:hypothetical protein
MNTTPSVAAQVIVTVIPIVGIVAGAVVVFFYLYWNHSMKMMMIEKGLFQKQQKSYDIMTFSLLAGLLLACIGLGLFLFFYLMEGMSYSVLGGLIPLSIGLSFIIFFILKKVISKNNDGMENR